MKKTFSILLICLLTAFFIYDYGQAQNLKNNTKNCSIYFVDRQLHRLVPLPFSSLKTPEKTANAMVSNIIDGKATNSEILRLFPRLEDSISVDISGNTAHINLLGKLSSHMNKNAETETLFIYQIVNSLTSIDGIDYVQFTIDNKVQKHFLGFLDMREIFTANYDI